MADTTQPSRTPTPPAIFPDDLNARTEFAAQYGDPLPTEPLRIVADTGIEEGGIYHRHYQRFEVWQGDRYLTTHFIRRNATKHIQGKPVIVDNGPRLEVWLGAECWKFKSRQEALDFHSGLVRRVK